MFKKADSALTIGDLIAKKDYNIVVYCGYDAEKGIPKAKENKIGIVMGWLKVQNGQIVSDDKTYDETEQVLFFAEPFEKELVVVVDKKFFDSSELREYLSDLKTKIKERKEKEC